MRTLALLAALLLLALQARAQDLQEKADQVPAQDQPEAKGQDELWADDQDEAGAEDQDVVITFTGEERLAREASRPPKITIKKVCYCRPKCRVSIFNKFSERPSGVCGFLGRHTLCCK